MCGLVPHWVLSRLFLHLSLSYLAIVLGLSGRVFMFTLSSTVALRKSTHGWSTLQVCQRVGTLLSVSAFYHERAPMSCLHWVVLRGAVPDHCNLQTLHWSASNLLNNELYWCCLSKCCSLKFLDKILQEPQDSSWGTACPPHVYPHVYLMSCTWLFLPGLSSPFLHTASDQKLKVGTPWEWCYNVQEEPIISWPLDWNQISHVAC